MRPWRSPGELRPENVGQRIEREVHLRQASRAAVVAQSVQKDRIQFLRIDQLQERPLRVRVRNDRGCVQRRSIVEDDTARRAIFHENSGHAVAEADLGAGLACGSGQGLRQRARSTLDGYAPAAGQCVNRSVEEQDRSSAGGPWSGRGAENAPRRHGSLEQLIREVTRRRGPLQPWAAIAAIDIRCCGQERGTAGPF